MATKETHTDDVKIQLGCYKNVYISPNELAALHEVFGAYADKIIEELSIYKNHTGKEYDDASTVRDWCLKRKPGKLYLSIYNLAQKYDALHIKRTRDIRQLRLDYGPVINIDEDKCSIWIDSGCVNTRQVVYDRLELSLKDLDLSKNQLWIDATRDENEQALLNTYRGLSDTEKETFLDMAKIVSGASSSKLTKNEKVN